MPLYLHQALICGTYVLPQLKKFWDLLQNELSDESFYATSIGGMRLRLQKLQDKNKYVLKLRAEKLVKDN